MSQNNAKIARSYSYISDARNFLEDVRSEKTMSTLEDDEHLTKLNIVMDTIDRVLEEIHKLWETKVLD